MTHSKLSPYDFIQNAFCPHVAVLSSPLAEQTCQKGNLSFIEMVQPFCRLTSEVHFRDPSGSSVNVKNLRVVMLDVNSRPPQPTLARKYLNESVSSANVDQVTTHKFGDKNIEIPSTVPWFESWRETFLQVQFPADHEFTKHYLACVVVLSTAEPSPLEAARSLSFQLQQLQAVAPGRLPKWFAAPSPPLACYLLLHDASEGDTTKAEAALASIKEEFGASSCFLLTVNSRPPGEREDAGHLPDPWSQFLNKHVEQQDGVDSNYSSPRSPADIGTGFTPSVGGEHNLEMGQEVSEGGVISHPVPVVLHPLSPQSENPTLGPLTTEEPTATPVTANHVDGSPVTPHINSNVWAGASTANAPQLPHGTSLTAADLGRIRTFVFELCSRALVPHVERQIQYLSDQISNKKGVSRSFLSATKRWFGPNKPGSPRSTSSNNAVIYAGDAPELQLRRLADLCFMFRNYSSAYQAYHSAKRDFAADGAWLHYAGALEMAALSSFMTGEFNRKTQDYHEEAIITYLNTCRLPQFATRSTLLSVVCLKSRSLYSDAAKQLIRMTSEDSDLRSALLLEEASYCFLQASKPGLLRKYAFHMVLAGHRFSKAGQRRHSLRCYQQAYQVYEGKGWSLAEDHIHFTIGRQAGSLGQRALATKALSRLLAPGSKQVPAQQAYHLREYLVMQQQLSAETNPTELPLLPLPQVTSSSVQVLTGSPPQYSKTTDSVDASGISFDEESKESSSVWLSLEEQLLTESLGNPPVVFKPMLTLFNRFTDNSRQPVMVLKEPLWVCFTVNNPLGVQLPLQNVRLLWTFQAENSEDIIDSELADVSVCERWVSTQVVTDLILQGNASEKVILSLIPQGVGQLIVKGLAYRLTNPTALAEPSIPQTATTPICVEGKQVFILEPKKVPRPGKDRGVPTKAVDDLRLQPKVLSAAPLLQASFSTLPSELISGEIQRVTMTLVNCGSHPLKTLLLGSDTPNLFALDRSHPTGTVAKSRQNVVRLSLESGVLEEGSEMKLNLWIRTPDLCGKTKLKLLFFYESAIPGSTLKYRLLRHCWDLCILDSLQLTVTPRRSTALNQHGGLNITARVTNTNRVQDLVIVKVNLLQVSMSSTLWELNNLPVQPTKADVCLGPQECSHLLFRARSVSSKTSVLSDLALSPKVKDLVPLSDSPHYDFLLRHSWSGVQPKVGPQPPEPAEPRQPTTAAIAEAALRVDATFVVRWEAEITDAAQSVRHAFGQHHVTLVKLSDSASCPSGPRLGPRVGRPRSGEVASTVLRIFGPDRNVPSEADVSAEQGPSLEALQRLVTYYLQHQPRVTHNFDVQRLCFVQVHLFLRNCCESVLRVEVNLSGGQSSLTSRSQLYVPHASSVVRWVGQIVSHFELTPFGTHSLPLCAAITAPGTYDLGALLTVSCRFAQDTNAKDTVQDTRVHSAVVVNHSDGLVGCSDEEIQHLSHGINNMAVKDVSIPT